jgi:hypothetical protein
MNAETYSPETLQAIIAEAKRQGYDDAIIALNLDIARDDPAFMYAGDDQLRATISERLRRGEHRINIAADMGLTLDELVAIEGDFSLRVGLDDWTVCHADLDDAHHEESILHLIERGRASLKSARKGRLLTPRAVLALLVDAVGLVGTHAVIAAAMRPTEDMDAAAETLRIPKDAVKAVVWGSFPLAESAPTDATIH